ncbi:unnamed protein product, partial [Ceratitis capitata]
RQKRLTSGASQEFFNATYLRTYTKYYVWTCRTTLTSLVDFADDMAAVTTARKLETNIDQIDS